MTVPPLAYVVAFGVIGWAAVDAFGWLHGLGILAAVWMLQPYQSEPSEHARLQELFRRLGR